MTYTPCAEFSWTEGRAWVPAGGLIGRTIQASLRLVHPNISEAHALLTFRDGELRLQALRGVLQVDQATLHEIVLRCGMEIRLCDDVTLIVSNLRIPKQSLAFIVDGKLGVIPRLPCSVFAADAAAMVAHDLELGTLVVAHGCIPGAALTLYEDERGLWSQLPATLTQAVDLPTQWNIEGRAIRLVAVPLDQTSRTSGGLKKQRLLIAVRFDSVHIWVGVSPAPKVISGIPARIISELALLGNGPTNWETVAREIWTRDQERLPLREKWDKALKRLRENLRTLGVREDLVRVDRRGNVELVLYAEDAVRIDTGDVQAAT